MLGSYIAKPTVAMSVLPFKVLARPSSCATQRVNRVALTLVLLLSVTLWALAAEPRYATYLGGSNSEDVQFVLEGPDGGSVLVGSTMSRNFPGSHPFRDSEGNADVFVTRYDRLGAVVYSTVLGGSQLEYLTSARIALDGTVTVLGITHSRNFPCKKAFQPQSGGQSDSFVFRLNPGGNLVYSTYLGGQQEDEFRMLEIDEQGCAYIAGSTASPDYRTTRGAFIRLFGNGKSSRYPGHDGVLTKLGPSGRAVYSTYIGGRSDDGIRAIHILAGGDVLVSGSTTSGNFKTKNSSQSRLAGGEDSFLVRLTTAGKPLYSQLLGGSGSDYPMWSDVNADGSVVVWGKTESTDLPVLNAMQPSIANRGSFVARYAASGALVYVTYIGCIQPPDRAGHLSVDNDGTCYISANALPAYRDEFPLVSAFDSTSGGYAEATMTKIAPDGACVFSTFIGGSEDEAFVAMDVTSDEGVTMVGVSNSPDFPTIAAVQETHGGLYDLVVVKLDRDGRPVFSTFYGGSGFEEIVDAVINGAGDALVFGTTDSPDFPATPGSFPRARNSEAFVAKIDAQGNLAYSTLLGADVDNGESSARLFARDDGGAVITSVATLSQRPTLHEVNALPSGHGFEDSMAVFLDRDGRLELSTYLGGSSSDRLRSVILGQDGAATITLFTSSPDLPVRAAAQAESGGENDVFVISLAP